MWQKPIKKTIFTLRVDNYAPEICEFTFPLLKAFAKKIGADFHVITERRFPEFPPVMEKLQIYELAQEIGSDWNWYLDADALVHPDMFDVTVYLSKDTVCHNGHDLAGNRWSEDRFFWRDGRHISSCNWCTIASDWCIELWKPLDDLTLEEAVSRIRPVVTEYNSHVIQPSHLIDDFTLSRNISRFGLKFTTISEIVEKHKITGPMFWHHYLIPKERKVEEMKKVLKGWRLL